MLVLAAVAGCSTVPDAVNPVEWYKSAERTVVGGDEAPPEGDSAAVDGRVEEGVPGADRPFPNLADVPERPEARTPAQTTQLEEGLVADRARARYSSEPIPLQGMSGEGGRSLQPGVISAGADAADAAAATAGAERLRAPAVQRLTPGVAPGGAGPAAQAGLSPQQRMQGPQRPQPSPGGGVAFSDAPPSAGGEQPTQMMSQAPPAPPTFSDAPPPLPPRAAGQKSVAEQFTAAGPARDQSGSPPPPPNLREPTAAAPDAGSPPPASMAEASPGDKAGTAAGSGPEPSPAAPDMAAAPLPPALSESADGDELRAQSARPEQTAAGTRQRVATIRFGSGSASLGDPERDILRQVAELHERSGGTIRIVGHSSGADEAGGADDAVSRQRAIAVAEELVRLGIGQQQLQLAVRPASRNGTGDADTATRAAERRAEIFFVY